MLNLPAVLTATTGMDQYGFFTLEPVAARPYPLTLSLALGTLSAGAGYLAYLLLRKRAWFANSQVRGLPSQRGNLRSAGGRRFSPRLLSYAGYGNKPLVLGVAGIMATSLCITAALNDPKTRLDAGMARILFVVGAAIILLLTALAVAGMLVMYFVEHSPCRRQLLLVLGIRLERLGLPGGRVQPAS